jgi:hypothetical protein
MGTQLQAEPDPPPGARLPVDRASVAFTPAAEAWELEEAERGVSMTAVGMSVLA